MARAGPRGIREYRLEFKVTAVRLSQQPGIQVRHRTFTRSCCRSGASRDTTGCCEASGGMNASLRGDRCHVETGFFRPSLEILEMGVDLSEGSPPHSSAAITSIGVIFAIRIAGRNAAPVYTTMRNTTTPT